MAENYLPPTSVIMQYNTNTIPCSTIQYNELYCPSREIHLAAINIHDDDDDDDDERMIG